MKKFALLFFAATVSVFSIGQKVSDDFDVSVAQPYGVIDARTKKYISTDNGFAFMVKMDGNIVHIQKFDVDGMKEVSSKTYEDLPKKSKYQDVVRVGNRIFFFYQAKDKKAGTHILYYREINTETGSFMSEKVALTSSRGVANSPLTPDQYMTATDVNRTMVGIFGKRFKFYNSFDGSKLLVHYRLEPKGKNDNVNNDEMGFFVFDDEMNQQYGGEIELPYTEAQINNVAYGVRSDGTAVMLAANRETKKYQAFIVKDNNLEVSDLDLSTDQLTRRIWMRENEEGHMICAGYYANGMEFKMSFGGGAMVYNANGIMYFEIDKDGALVQKKNFDFDIDFIKQNLNKRLKESVEKREQEDKAGILDLVSTDMIMKEDGSVILVGERQWARNEFYGPQQKMVYHFGNAIVTKINPDGTLGWMRKLPKNQAGTVPGGGQMSISYMEGNGADYVAFVDNPKNIALGPEDGIPAAHKDGLGGWLTTYKVDHATGNVEKHNICDLNAIEKYKAYQFKVWRIFRAGKGAFMMEIYIKKKQDTMVKFAIKGS